MREKAETICDADGSVFARSCDLSGKQQVVVFFCCFFKLNISQTVWHESSADVFV